MRFDKRLTFVTEVDGRYDPELGDYVPGTNYEETMPCNVSRLGVERTNELFGQMDKVITVIRLQRPYNKKFDYLYLGNQANQKLNIQRRSDYRKGVFYIEGGLSG